MEAKPCEQRGVLEYSSLLPLIYTDNPKNFGLVLYGLPEYNETEALNENLCPSKLVLYYIFFFFFWKLNFLNVADIQRWDARFIQDKCM